MFPLLPRLLGSSTKNNSLKLAPSCWYNDLFGTNVHFGTRWGEEGDKSADTEIAGSLGHI